RQKSKPNDQKRECPNEWVLDAKGPDQVRGFGVVEDCSKIRKRSQLKAARQLGCPAQNLSPDSLLHGKGFRVPNNEEFVAGFAGFVEISNKSPNEIPIGQGVASDAPADERQLIPKIVNLAVGIATC